MFVRIKEENMLHKPNDKDRMSGSSSRRCRVCWSIFQSTVESLPSEMDGYTIQPLSFTAVIIIIINTDSKYSNQQKWVTSSGDTSSLSAQVSLIHHHCSIGTFVCVLVLVFQLLPPDINRGVSNRCRVCYWCDLLVGRWGGSQSWPLSSKSGYENFSSPCVHSANIHRGRLWCRPDTSSSRLDAFPAARLLRICFIY